MDLFHEIALEEYAKALLIGKERDSDYIRRQVYERYEREKQEEKGT